MSAYTSILLYISGMENESDRIKEVNKFINKGHSVSLINVNNSEKYPDAFPRFLYVGTYKQFDTSGFLFFLVNNVKWEYPEYVQILVQEEEDYTLKVYSNAGRNLVLDSYKQSDE